VAKDLAAVEKSNALVQRMQVRSAQQSRKFTTPVA